MRLIYLALHQAINALFVWLIRHGWKYYWLICCERKILFVGWKNTAYKSSEQGVTIWQPLIRLSRQPWRTHKEVTEEWRGLTHILVEIVSIAQCTRAMEARRSLRWTVPMDENGSDTNGYHLYYICFYIFVRIRTRIAFGYIYEYGLTRLRIRIMSIEYGMNRIRRRSDTNIYSDIE